MTAKQATILAHHAAREFYNADQMVQNNLAAEAFNYAKEWRDTQDEAAKELRELAQYGGTFVIEAMACVWDELLNDGYVEGDAPTIGLTGAL
jgi:uncharacterized protein YdaT